MGTAIALTAVLWGTAGFGGQVARVGTKQRGDR